MTFDSATGLPRRLRAFVVMRDPKMVVVPHFLSVPECDHLMRLVDNYWMPSLVGQATYSTDEEYSKGDLQNTLSQTRTSWSCMMRYAQTSVVERIEHRLAALTGLPVAQLERLNMLRYAPGELFNEHHDGKFRPMTVFVYLNDLPEGEERGDTFFPCLGVSFRPRKGTAVMWNNVEPGQTVEDSRTLHQGRAPIKGVKYGVNCFFNVCDMRQVMQTGPDIPREQAATVKVRELRRPSGNGDQQAPDGEGTSSSSGSKESKLVAYRLCADPKLMAVPSFVSEAEAAHLNDLARQGGDEPAVPEPFAQGTQPIRTLEAAQTPVVSTVEERLAATAGLGLECLARLRIVRPGLSQGLCNRGCGPKSAYICLGEREEIYFPRLGIRLLLRTGDLVMWPNVDWETGKAVEDIRTVRAHFPGTSDNGEELPLLGVDAFFHDNPLREQQKQRKFVSDVEAVAAQAVTAAAAAGGSPATA